MTHRTIGRLATEACVSVETIRYYERLGLIEKPRPGCGSKWRVYEDRAVWALRYVRIAQDLGFSLAEIGELLGAASQGPPLFCRTVRAAVTGKLAQVDKDIAALQARRAAIIGFLDACGKRDDSPDCPIFQHLRPGETR